MEPRGLLLCLPNSATAPYPEPGKSNPYPQPYFFKIYFNIILLNLCHTLTAIFPLSSSSQDRASQESVGFCHTSASLDRIHVQRISVGFSVLEVLLIIFASSVVAVLVIVSASSVVSVLVIVSASSAGWRRK
jgi:hypothetical protein